LTDAKKTVKGPLATLHAKWHHVTIKKKVSWTAKICKILFSLFVTWREFENYKLPRSKILKTT